MVVEKEKRIDKGYFIAGAVILIAIICMMCILFLGKNSVTEKDATKINFNLKITCDATEVIFDENLTANENESLMEIMKKNTDTVEEDGFITSILGREQNADEFRYWMYSINGEQAQIGAAEYYPAEDDEIIFDLSVLSW